MADPTPPTTDGTASRRAPVPGWVWIGLVAVAVAGALLAGWWFEREDNGPPTAAPGQPAAFCAAVSGLQGAGEISVDIGTGAQGTQGLRDAAAGLRRLAAADPPASIRDDIDQLAGALDEVVAQAEAVAPDDATGLDRVLTVLDTRLRELQAASDRVDAYTQRWCGASVNPTPTTG
jgi:hypothetical protein